jgi:hypothetical protein
MGWWGKARYTDDDDDSEDVGKDDTVMPWHALEDSTAML